jgi:hypothetical protein
MTDHRLPPLVAQRIEAQAARVAELQAELRRAAADLDAVHRRLIDGVPSAVLLARQAPDARLAAVHLRRWVDGAFDRGAEGDA